MDSDFIFLAILFFCSGMLSMLYYVSIPSGGELRRRLPNRASIAAIVLTLVLGALFIYVVRSTEGIRRISRIFTLLFGALVFETMFILLMRWIRSDLLNVILSLSLSGTLVAAYFVEPSFITLNIIIILAMFGAASLLIRMNFLRTRILFILTGLWVIYDVLFVNYILPRFTSPTAEAFPTFLYPAVRVGDISLGSGDFMFLTLFSLVILRDFGRLPTLILLVLQALGLMVTGFLVRGGEVLVPFLVIMAPIFISTYFTAYHFTRSEASVT